MCWRCLLVWCVGAPFLASYVLWRRYRHDRSFKEALEDFAIISQKARAWREAMEKEDERERQKG